MIERPGDKIVERVHILVESGGYGVAGEKLKPFFFSWQTELESQRRGTLSR